MPRALIVVHSYYVRDTRVRRHAAVLARAGWQVEVVCARDEHESEREEIGGVLIHRLPSRRKRGSKLRYMFEYVSFALLAWFKIRNLAHKKFDAAIVIGIPNFLVAAAGPVKRKGARVLLDMRDPLPEFFVAKYSIAEGSAVHKFFLAEERWSCKRADLVLTVVPSMARLYERSIDPSRIRLVMNAPDTRMFKRVEPIRPASDRTMLYTGTVAPRYGVDLAVRAVSELKDKIPDLRFRIVGDGDLVAECRKIAQDLRIGDRVEFMPAVALEQVPALVAGAWLGVQPNRHDELMEHSLSTKILEWARLGLPVVAGTTAPLLDVFGPDSGIWLHTPGDLDDLCRCILDVHASSDIQARLQKASAAASSIDFKHEAAALVAAASGLPEPIRNAQIRKDEG